MSGYSAKDIYQFLSEEQNKVLFYSKFAYDMYVLHEAGHVGLHCNASETYISASLSASVTSLSAGISEMPTNKGEERC